MGHTTWIAAAALACASCGRAAATHEDKPDRIAFDPCGLVTPDDISALGDGPAVAQAMGHGECKWHHELPDRANWSLSLEIQDTAVHPGPVVIVTPPEITYQGAKLTPDDPTITEQLAFGMDRHAIVTRNSRRIEIYFWTRRDALRAHLTLTSAGSTITTKLDAVKQLARKVDAALALRAPAPS